MTTRKAYRYLVGDNLVEHGWSWPGETYFKTLEQVRPYMAAAIRGTHLDPSPITKLTKRTDPIYRRWLDFQNWIERNWDLYRADGEGREIKNTRFDATQDWPEDVMIQGGGDGLVMDRKDGGKSYRTAFVEVFPGGTFLRGEGATVPEAEMNAWRKYVTWRDCIDGTGQHGEWKRGTAKNGIAWCGKCGAYCGKQLEELPLTPEEEKEERNHPLVRMLNDDPVEVLGEIVDAYRTAKPKGAS